MPKDDLARGGRSTDDPNSPHAVIGVWSTASRQRSRVFDGDGTITNSGPWVQISRLGNPLVNEVLIPIGTKDYWNSQVPADDSQFVKHYSNPELSNLLPPLYPGVFPNLAKLDASGAARTDIIAILLTGLPSGIIPGFQNYTGSTQADQLRLNMAIPPTRNKPSNLGLIGMDLAGFPNGRRVFDDVTTIELRALAGATYPLVQPSYTPDAAAGILTQGLTSSNTDLTAENTVHYIRHFPYLGLPHSGFFNPGDNTPAPDLGQGKDEDKEPWGGPATGDGATEGGIDKKLLIGGAASVGAAAVAAVAHQRAGRHAGAETAAAPAGTGSDGLDAAGH